MYIADLHIHSRYSRATSHDCTPEVLELWARKKGIRLLGTGDFTHPAWREELKEKLIPAEEGLYALKEEYRIRDGIADDSERTRFVVTGEISSIYKQGDRVRKVHSLLMLPGLYEAERLSARLEQIGNIHSDGRPILGLSCHDLLEIMLETCPDAVYIPAHIWTPHFSLFGAFSGFDTIEDCFGDLTSHIHALETGLSSDPPMNWRISALDRYQLVSNSDAHSPAKLGREANLFDTELSYPALTRAIETGEGLLGTIEFFPEEGKYHFDGHRKCHLCLSPSETIKYGGKCPVCGKKLTIGVSHRVEELADREEGYVRSGGKLFESMVPLPEVIAASIGKSAASVRVQRLYNNMVGQLGDEFSILRDVPEEDIKRAAGTMIAEGIRRLRRGTVERKPGFDGEYGTIRLFEPWELNHVEGQLSLFLPTMEGWREVSLAERESSEPEDAIGGETKPEDAIAGEPGPEDGKPKSDCPVREEMKRKNESANIKSDDLRLPPYLEKLNENQREAATVLSRAVAVMAGPGTGKTATLTARVLWLLKERGVKPSEITAVTFTNKAAQELRERLEKQAGGKRVTRLLNVGTFHALSMKLLKENGFDRIPAPEEMLLELASDIVKEYKIPMRPTEFLRQLSLEKASQVSNWFSGDIPICEAATAYQERLSAEGICDFDDLLLETLKLFDTDLKRGIRRHFTYLQVDEFQDVNPIQLKLIKAWNRGGKELFVIGDPDQSVYGFRGTDSTCFEYLRKEYPEIQRIALTKNYRSVPAILQGAQAVISENPGPVRMLEPVCGVGAKIRLVTAKSNMSEAIFVAKEINRLVGGIDMLDAQERRTTGRLTGFSDIAVLYRTHRQAALLEKCLRQEGIPYRVGGRDEFLSDKDVRGCIAFFRSLNPEDSFARRLSRRLLWKGKGPKEWEETFEKARGHYLPLMEKGEPSALLEVWLEDMGLKDSRNMEKLLQLSYMYSDIKEFLDALTFGTEGDLFRPGKKQYRSDAVTLMTLHASKGLEFPAVVLCGVRKGLIPMEWKGMQMDNTEEERRLLYVGMTRAMEQLILVTGKEQSEFLGILPEDCLIHEDAGGEKKSEEENGMQLSLFDWARGR